MPCYPVKKNTRAAGKINTADYNIDISMPFNFFGAFKSKGLGLGVLAVHEVYQ
jgi:hypothetical protein